MSGWIQATMQQNTSTVYYLYPVTYTVRPSVDAGEMITPVLELGPMHCAVYGLGITRDFREEGVLPEIVDPPKHLAWQIQA